MKKELPFLLAIAMLSSGLTYLITASVITARQEQSERMNTAIVKLSEKETALTRIANGQYVRKTDETPFDGLIERALPDSGLSYEGYVEGTKLFDISLSRKGEIKQVTAMSLDRKSSLISSFDQQGRPVVYIVDNGSGKKPVIVEFFEDGKVKKEQSARHAKEYHADGLLKARYTYNEKGLLNGDVELWDENGTRLETKERSE